MPPRAGNTGLTQAAYAPLNFLEILQLIALTSKLAGSSLESGPLFPQPRRLTLMIFGMMLPLPDNVHFGTCLPMSLMSLLAILTAKFLKKICLMTACPPIQF